jgi:subtilase family serine protease
MNNSRITFRALPRWLLRAAVLLFCGICPVFGAELKVLHGHVPKVISSLTPKGRLTATNELRLAIGLPMRDRAGLDNFVAQVSDPASPNFRQYLTREELTERFGPTEQDYEAVKNFAQSNGLAIEVTHANRLLLDVTGPAAAVEKAFHITLRTYRHPTEARDFFAPDTEPMVEAGLPVVDILGLSDFSRPHPKWARRTKENAAKAASRSGTAPDKSGDLFGNDFRNAYLPGVTLTGAGQSVGLVEFDGFFTKDITNYAAEAGNGRTNIVIQTVLLDGYNGKASTGINGGEVEVELDIEMVMSIAPGLAKIVSYEAGENGNQNDVLNAMLANSNVVNLSCSWGWSGPSNSTDVIFESMDAVGQTFFNASGDSQAFTPGSNSVNGVDNPAAFNAPSSNPYITQVGGTTMTMNGAGVSWASEVVWNWAVEYDDPGVGSSGGISSYYSIPYWQTNVSNMAARGGSTGFRNIPDVAANADNVYVLYSNGKHTDGIGGTSCAAPLWAGFMALVNQQSAASGGKVAGFINPALYTIAAGSSYASCFHDVTSGNNTWSSSPNLFYATNNYDLCTGLGTINGQSLINALASSGTLAPAITNLSASLSITYGATGIILSGKIIASGPFYPTNGEAVTVMIDGHPQTTQIDDSTGDFTFNYDPHTIPASGTAYTITYSYGGDTLLQPATNTSTTLTVNLAALSITAGAQSKTYRQTVTFGSGSTNFTSGALKNGETIGTVTLAVSGNGGAATAAAGTYTITPSAATGGSGTESDYAITYMTNTLIVNPLAVTLTGTRPYNGMATAQAAILTIVTNYDGANLTLSGSAVLAGSGVGVQSITNFTGLALGGAAAANYTLTGASGTVTISNPHTPFSITCSSLNVAGTNLVVCWQSVPGAVYKVLTNTSLVPAQSWMVTGSPILATGTNTCFTLPGGIVGNTNTFVLIQEQ